MTSLTVVATPPSAAAELVVPQWRLDIQDCRPQIIKQIKELLYKVVAL